MEPNDDDTRTHVELTKGSMVSHYRIVEKSRFVAEGVDDDVSGETPTKYTRRFSVKKQTVVAALTLGGCLVLALNLGAYPPAVGILGNSKDCMACHVDNGPWKDDGTVIIDIVDKQTKQSLKQPDGTFLIEAKRGELKTVLTVIGSLRQGESEAPTRNAWIYVDPEMIGASALSCFAPGWNINLPMACRVVGDKWDDSIDADYTVLPMSVRPTDAAQDASVVLQVMLTKGASVKGKAKEGLIGSYFERQVKLKVLE